MTTTLTEFFNIITGMGIDMDNPIHAGLMLTFGFLIVYDVIHILFSSVFGFTAFNTRK